MPASRGLGRPLRAGQVTMQMRALGSAEPSLRTSWRKLVKMQTTTLGHRGRRPLVGLDPYLRGAHCISASYIPRRGTVKRSHTTWKHLSKKNRDSRDDRDHAESHAGARAEVLESAHRRERDA